ncbi:MAG TPA: AgmX/PglI C-terminal domain-containing protein [Polyangia bacterium]|jgi:hypothetical protein
MKALLVLLVLSAAGLAGVIYFRRSLHAPAPAVVASADGPAKKERPRRRRHGARRLARNSISAAPVPSSPGEAPVAEAPVGEAPPPVFAPTADEPPPLIPGGASVSEAPPDDVFGPAGPSPSQAPTGGRRQAVEEPAPVKLRAADVKMVWQGEDLSRTETMRLDMSNDGGHDLTDAEIDARFRTKEEAVLACIARSRPNESTDVPGRVTVKFRIQRTGTVKGVQVEAPVILHKGGLMGCIKNVMGSLRFPASNNGQVVSFPFSLM